MKKINKSLTIIILISLVYLIASISYSYFQPQYLNKEDATTLSSNSGEMEISYTGGPNISSYNMKPSTDPFAVKNFTVAGKNAFDELMEYSINLNVTLNTFSDGAISYELIGTNTDGNGLVASENERTSIDSGALEKFIANANFSGIVNNVSHSYTLNIYFYDKGERQNQDMGKEFEAHVVIKKAKEFNNKPNLVSGMTPIKFAGLTEIETISSDKDWYDYENKKWANAKTADGSYWVWIPRYAYKIASCYHMNTTECQTEIGKDAGDIEIIFLQGASNGNNSGVSISSTPTYAASSQTNFVKHPAFTFGSEEIEGFWISKFELGGTSADYVSKPNIQSANNETVGSFFTNIKTMKTDSKFGWGQNEVDTHMIKNIEWGAVAYLTQSIYGANSKIYINNSSSHTTGCAGNEAAATQIYGCQNSWNTAAGTKASTTHNITGIYDMSGGISEYVSGFGDTGQGVIESNGLSLKTSYLTDGDKYVDYYTSPNNFYRTEYLGDAWYETSSSEVNNNSWYNSYSFGPESQWVFMIRGGYYTEPQYASVFNITTGGGVSHSNFTSRAALVSLN